jgi:hypothetical protein
MAHDMRRLLESTDESVNKVGFERQVERAKARPVCRCAVAAEIRSYDLELLPKSFGEPRPLPA